ncbi:hypothetical protein ACV1C0_24755, partial [Aeromonas hydrophila]
GLGAPRNRVHAYAWLSLAATEGMPEAVRARDELEAAMTKPEVKQAQKLSEHWFGKMSSTAKKAKKKEHRRKRPWWAASFLFSW